MSKIIGLAFVYLFSQNIFPNSKIACGSYLLQGSIKRIDSDLFLVANEKSKSEYRFKIIDRSKFNALNFLDQKVSLKAEITRTHSPFNFDISIKEIKEENSKGVFNPTRILESKCQN